VISDGATTSKIDDHGAVLASVGRGGRVAVDAVGNVFLARAASGVLTLEKLSSSLAPVWTTNITTESDARLLDLSVNAAGGPTVGLVSANTRYAYAMHFTSGGGFIHVNAFPGYLIALDGDNAVVAYDDGAGNSYVDKYSFNSDVIWHRYFAGSAGFSTLAAARDGGAVFGGELTSPMDFGGGTLPTYYNENGGDNGYVVRLDGGGNHVFSQRTGYAYVTSVATNGQRIAVSGYERTQFYYWRFGLFDMSGAPATGEAQFSTGWGEMGFGRDVFIAPDGRLWWTTTTLWWPSGPTYLLAL
jgi:hypothetical protein